MGLLDRLGVRSTPPVSTLRRARVRPDPARQPLSRRKLLVRGGLLAVLVLTAVLVFPTQPVDEYAVRVGDAWQGRDVIAPFDFPIRIPEEEFQRKLDSVRYTQPPIFVEEPGAVARMNAAADSLRDQLDTVFAAYANWQVARSRGQREQAMRDSLRYWNARNGVPLALTPDQWEALVASYADRVQGLGGATREATGPALADQLIDRALRIGRSLAQDEVLDVPKDSIHTDVLIVRNTRTRVERRMPRSAVVGAREALDTASNELTQVYGARPDTVQLALSVLREIFQPTLRLDTAATREAYEQAEQSISPVRGRVRQGIIIVRRGDEVTPDVQAQLTSLAYANAEQRGAANPWRIILGQVWLSAAAFLVFFLYLYLLRRAVFMQPRLLLLVTLLFVLVLLAYGIAVRTPTEAALAVPVGLASVLLTVLFDSRVGLFGTVTLALLGGLVFGFDFEFAFATTIAGTVAVFSVRDVKNRSQFFVTMALVFATYVVVLASYALLRTSPIDRLLGELVLVAINALLLLLAYPLLWVFERLFRVTTDISLLELSDTNRPILKELSLKAPGTFNHVLQVANLAEAAANAVGANALLARVGALYHDIGKMLKPEYYVENQQGGLNPHDKLSPYMSALIIASHVKDGLELGRADRLPDVVLQFIATHHGTTLMEYFYNRAQAQQEPGAPSVDPQEFRYPGPRPQCTEEALVMLADSVEAASRSLDKPTPRRLEALIDAIFKARAEDGQLDGTALTFADLHKIKDTFLAILTGIYHVRIKYPDQDRITGETDAPPVEGTVPAKEAVQAALRSSRAEG